MRLCRLFLGFFWLSCSVLAAPKKSQSPEDQTLFSVRAPFSTLILSPRYDTALSLVIGIPSQEDHSGPLEQELTAAQSISVRQNTIKLVWETYNAKTRSVDQEVYNFQLGDFAGSVEYYGAWWSLFRSKVQAYKLQVVPSTLDPIGKDLSTVVKKSWLSRKFYVEGMKQFFEPASLEGIWVGREHVREGLRKLIFRNTVAAMVESDGLRYDTPLSYVVSLLKTHMLIRGLDREPFYSRPNVDNLLGILSKTYVALDENYLMERRERFCNMGAVWTQVYLAYKWVHGKIYGGER